jgi:glyoxylase-like metal-dependent hydrolase (beta-lactamase superfamily II)/rhodanese-related sulfurtransferase
MIFRQLIDADLGCACYLVGDAGRGLVVDPGLDVEPVLAAAAEEGLRIELVLETHVHTDHVSGRALLAERTGASVRVPGDGGHDPTAGGELRDGDTIDLGAVRLTALAAPGHRPEHVALLVADRSRSPEPWLLLGGDSLLVGALARPDLAIDPHDGARALHATVERLAALPDGVELWPGHVGGSLCGGPGLSRKTSSTLGYERAANPLLQADPDEFAEQLIASLPVRPPTVAHVVARNRTAAPAPAGPIVRLAPGAFADALEDGVTLLDARSADAFDDGHLRGSLSLTLRGSGLGTRAAWLLASGDELAVLADEESTAAELARRLLAVGLGPLRGITVDDVAVLGAASGRPLDVARPIAVAELPNLVGEVTVVDVREASEWRAGHLPGTVHVPLNRLRAEAARLPNGPLAVVCARGPRAAFAASWLRARGHDARRVAGGGIPDLPGVGLQLVAA